MTDKPEDEMVYRLRQIGALTDERDSLLTVALAASNLPLDASDEAVALATALNALPDGILDDR